MGSDWRRLAALLGTGIVLAVASLGIWDVAEMEGLLGEVPRRWLHLGRGLSVAGVLMLWGVFSMWVIGRGQQELLERTLANRTRALVEERALSEALLESSEDAFLVWDRAGRIQHASPSAERMFGYSAAELRGRRLRSLLDEEHHTEYDRRLELSRVREAPTGLGRAVTLKGRRRDGSRFPFEMVPSEIDVGGRPAVAAMLRDVTRRVEADQVRRRSASLRALIEELPDAVMVHQNKRLLYANRRLLEMLGFDRPEDVLGRSIHDLLHPDDWERVDARLEQLQTTGKPPERAEERFLSRTGEVVTLEVAKVSVVFDARPAVVAIGRDVSARRAAEHRFRHAVESAPSGMVMIDPKGTIVLVNRQVETLFGYSENELLGRPIEMLVPEPYRDGHPALRSAFFERPSTRPMGIGRDLYGLRKDGSEIPVEIGLNPLRTDEGMFVLGSIVDISERRKAEGLLSAADRLTAVGTLAAGVAHGINNPLAYVKGNVVFARSELRELVSKDSDAEANDRFQEIGAALEHAAEGADRIRDIVGDLLTFARQENADEVQGADLHAVLDSVVQMTRNELHHRARVEKRYGRVPPVAGEPSRLAHAFTNLLVNAAHALPDGEADRNRVELTTWTDERTGHAVVEIRDTGCGMSADALRHAREPFFTTKPVGVGTGLGLSVTHGIVVRLGGSLHIESEPGVGTLARVQLPQGQAPSQDDGREGWRRACAKGRRILVIDDEPRALEMFERLLRSHEVVTAENGRAALERVRASEPFDVIFCDLIMPELTGAQFFDALSRKDPDQAGRIVFMTGGAFTEESRRFLERVPNPRLEKPVEPEDLAEAIEAIAG